jgi:hypothetical protein
MMADCDGEVERLFEEALPWEKRRAVLDVLVKEAISGDVRVAEYLIDRLYGRPGMMARAIAAEPEAAPLDMSVLNDEEAIYLADLLGRCETNSGSQGRGAGGEAGGGAPEVPE